ncbi:MAG: ABC transporter substrate-binding protein [Oscillospiraceae bacterium]
MKKRLLALSLALCMAFGLAACKPAAPEVTPTATPTATPAEKTAVNFTVLKGPTGMGAVKLMADNDAKTAQNDYTFTVAADNPEVAGLLTKGETDIAAMASNVAASLYNKTGDIQTIALGTLGVLYIMDSTGAVKTMNDLAGRTLYATGQGANPEYILRYILEQNGLEMGGDVNVQWLPSDELVAKAAAGEISLCMLPVPAATALMVQTKDAAAPFKQALDLTAEWKATENGSQLTMTSVVVRKAFLEEHPEAVAAFLEEYAASIEYVNQNAADASKLMEQYGIVPKAKIGELAVPQANLVCITGDKIQETIQAYYEILFAADAKSIGGSVPSDGFYFKG